MFFKVGQKNIFKINTYLKNPEDCTETNVNSSYLMKSDWNWADLNRKEAFYCRALHSL